MTKTYKKILIVDDEPMLVKVLRRFLVHEGHVTYEAGSASEALRLFREEQPFHVLLCDVYLGVDSGWTLAEQLYTKQPSLHIVMVTGAVILHEPEELFPYSLLFKPFNQERLRKVIEVHDP